MATSLQPIITVTSRIASEGLAATPAFGGVLFATDDSTLDASGPGRVGSYANLDEVDDAFGDGSAVRTAARSYFGQSPYPKPLVVARWPNAAVATVIIGSTTTSAPGDWASLGSSARQIKISLNGASEVTTTLAALSSVTTHAGMATALAAALNGNNALSSGDTWTCTYDTDHFELSTGTSNQPLAVSVSADGLGTSMGLADTIAQSNTTGSSQETAAQFLAGVAQENNDWYWVTLDDTFTDTTFASSMATAVEASGGTDAGAKQLLLDSHNSTLILSNPSGDAHGIATNGGTGRERTSILWSRTADYKAVSLAARFSGVDFEGSDTVITAKFKSLPGTTYDKLNRTEIGRLDGLRINHYTRFGSQAIVAEGVTTRAGVWSDVRYWIDWFTQAAQNALYTLLRTENRVPETDAGIARLIAEIDDVCETGVTNGGISPGTLPTATTNRIRQVTGNADFSGTLNNGYLVYVDDLSDRTANDIAARRAPRVHVWLHGSGAIHHVNIDLTFSEE